MRGLAVALLLLPLAACAGEQDPGLMPAEESTGAVEPSEDEPAAEVPEGVTVTDLPEGPVGLTAFGGQVYAALPASGQVWAGEGRTLPAGELPLRVLATRSGLWVSLIGEAALVRLDPRSGDAEVRVDLRPGDSEPEGLAYADGSVWVVDQAGDRVVEVDDRTGEVLGEHPTGAEPRLATAGPSGVFVTAYTGGSLTRVAGGEDQTRNAGSCLTPQGLAEAAGTVWVACTVDGQVVGIDARTLRPTVAVPDLPGADAVVTDGATVWVVGQEGPTVWALDPESGEVHAELVLDAAPATNENVDAVLVGDRLVVSHPETQRLYDVPLRLLR